MKKVFYMIALMAGLVMAGCTPVDIPQAANTGVPGGIASKEAYGFYVRAMEADPANFRALEEMDKLAEKLNLPATERLATMEKYRKTAEIVDQSALVLLFHDGIGVLRLDPSVG